MIKNKSKITLEMTIDSESNTEPQTNKMVWPNLSYEQVLEIEKLMIGVLTELNAYGYKQLDK